MRLPRDPAETNNPSDAEISKAERDCDNETNANQGDRKTAKQWNEIVASPRSLRHPTGGRNGDRRSKREIPQEPQSRLPSLAELPRSVAAAA